MNTPPSHPMPLPTSWTTWKFMAGNMFNIDHLIHSHTTKFSIWWSQNSFGTLMPYSYEFPLWPNCNSFPSRSHRKERANISYQKNVHVLRWLYTTNSGLTNIRSALYAAYWLYRAGYPRSHPWIPYLDAEVREGSNCLQPLPILI